MRLLLLLAAAAALASGSASAQDSDAAPAAPDTAFGTAAVDENALRSVAGREDIGTLVARADQRNVVSNNSVSGNSVTGAVSIDGNAFQNLQGMAVVSANSGNNVAMNAALNVTINMAPR